MSLAPFSSTSSRKENPEEIAATEDNGDEDDGNAVKTWSRQRGSTAGPCFRRTLSEFSGSIPEASSRHSAPRPLPSPRYPMGQAAQTPPRAVRYPALSV